jgi:hypothetical protein
MIKILDYMLLVIKAITDPLFYKRKMIILISSIQVVTWKEYDEEECARMAYIVYSHWLGIEQLHDACSSYFSSKAQTENDWSEQSNS